MAERTVLPRSGSAAGLLAATLVATGACGGDVGGGGGGVGAPSTASSGDTAVVTNPADLRVPVDTVAQVVTVWQDAELERPTVLVAAGERLVVGDQVRLHLVDRAGGVQTVGRRGEGPGEFGWIAGIAVRNDTIVVLDGRLLRHSLFDAEGAYLGSHPVTWPVPWVNPPRNGDAMALRGDSLVRVATENVTTTRPQREALLVQPLSGDTARVERSWDDARWIELGSSGLGSPVLYDARGLVALASDGRYALADGRDYCIDVQEIDLAPVLRVCRAWERREPGPGVRGASADDLPDDMREDFREMLRAQFELQEIAPLMPSFDRMAFGEDGSLWVRTIGPETPDVHPNVLTYRPELRAPLRAWDRFDREGRLTRTAWLPATFDPRVFEEDTVWGFSSLATGEMVLARADLPPG